MWGHSEKTANPVRQPVTYEHPLNERVRNLLRLELLFRQAIHCQAGETAWDSRLFISTLIDILAVLSRSDLKTELIKELERQQISLGKLRDKPHIDREQLAAILKHLDTLRCAIHATSGPLGQELRENDFLTAIRQRSTIPGGTCDFDIPAYHLWLSRPVRDRKSDQERWLESLRLTRQGVDTLLQMIRTSARMSGETAPAGGYQRNLEPDLPYQMVRIALEPDLPFFAEISGGKHRFTIRFMERSSDGQRAQQIKQDVKFELACCAL
jgi:cell division protein ZapD